MPGQRDVAVLARTRALRAGDRARAGGPGRRLPRRRSPRRRAAGSTAARAACRATIAAAGSARGGPRPATRRRRRSSSRSSAPLGAALEEQGVADRPGDGCRAGRRPRARARPRDAPSSAPARAPGGATLSVRLRPIAGIAPSLDTSRGRKACPGTSPPGHDNRGGAARDSRRRRPGFQRRRRSDAQAERGHRSCRRRAAPAARAGSPSSAGRPLARRWRGGRAGRADVDLLLADSSCGRGRDHGSSRRRRPAVARRRPPASARRPRPGRSRSSRPSAAPGRRSPPVVTGIATGILLSSMTCAVKAVANATRRRITIHQVVAFLPHLRPPLVSPDRGRSRPPTGPARPARVGLGSVLQGRCRRVRRTPHALARAVAATGGRSSSSPRSPSG